MGEEEGGRQSIVTENLQLIVCGVRLMPKAVVDN